MYGRCVWALLIGEVLPQAWGCLEVYTGGCVYASHVTLKCWTKEVHITCGHDNVLCLMGVRTHGLRASVRTENKACYYKKYIYN